MKNTIAASLVLLGLLVIWQPLAAHEQDVQAQLKDLRDLLAQQQKELAALNRE
jgi:type II secretory pathway component PulM